MAAAVGTPTTQMTVSMAAVGMAR
eukprot:COSAG04_NODE_5785_length_1494_cov_1.102509_1_plen_24_part_10